MAKYSRFSFLNKLLFLFFVFYFALYYIEVIMQDFLGDYYRYLKVLYGLFAFAKTMLILGIIAIMLYILYASYRYLTSAFYQKKKIPVHEAYFHGYFDLAYAYDRLRGYGGEISVDTKTKSIIVVYDHTIYYIIVRDIFGRLEGEAKNDTWYIVSKKRKQYGNIRYLTRKPLPNPIVENRLYINKLPKQEGVELKNYVCLTGFRRNTFQHDQINTIYEMEGILYQENYHSTKTD